jgi:sterol 3beta-glucosyltransferase
MKIVILTAGTRGDVEPCLALSLGLRRAGCDVTLAADTHFEGFVTSRGVHFAPIRADFLAFFQSPDGKALLARDHLRFLRGVSPSVLAMRQRMMEDAWAAVRGADAVVYHPRVLGAYDAVERLGVPAVLVEFLPILVPTRSFPFPLAPHLRLGGFVNRLSYAAVRLANLPYQDIRNRWRARALGLPPRPWYADDYRRRGRRLPVLYAFSRHVIPPPEDWRGRAEVTGYWFLDTPSDWRPPQDLAAFLAAGPPPVFVGFGSMISPDAGRVTATVVEALKKCGQRGILATGWGGLSRVHEPGMILQVESVPHGWLFPQVAAVVHHGGMGTTAAGLRAGKPTLVCPYFHDQPFWGKVVHGLGAGPPPIPQRELTAERLAEAIRLAVLDEGMRRRAEDLGSKIRAEDGVPRAVEAIGRHLSGVRPGGKIVVPARSPQQPGLGGPRAGRGAPR